MGRIASLAILTQDGAGKDYLAETYGKVIEGVMKTLVSANMKNADLSGNPASGSVEAKRFVNYGEFTVDEETMILLAAIIHCEARGESYEGQVAVGVHSHNVVLNTHN